MKKVYCLMFGDRLSTEGFSSLEKAQLECVRKGYIFEISPFLFSNGLAQQEVKIKEISIS